LREGDISYIAFAIFYLKKSSYKPISTLFPHPKYVLEKKRRSSESNDETPDIQLLFTKLEKRSFI
jgi:hypothetical protein